KAAKTENPPRRHGGTEKAKGIAADKRRETQIKSNRLGSPSSDQRSSAQICGDPLRASVVEFVCRSVPRKPALLIKFIKSTPRRIHAGNSCAGRWTDLQR